PREDEDNKSNQSHEQTDDLNRVQPCAVATSPEKHCCLDCAEQKERARSGRESVVGKREGRGVSKQREPGDPIAMSATVIDRRYRRSAFAHRYDERKRERAGKNANKGKAGGVDAGFFERRSTKERITRERDHRQQGQEENSRAHVKIIHRFRRFTQITESESAKTGKVRICASKNRCAFRGDVAQSAIGSKPANISFASAKVLSDTQSQTAKNLFHIARTFGFLCAARKMIPAIPAKAA